jgi:YHS domain-containing protein
VAGRSAGVVAQPGAQLGKDTYCPISGVVFTPNAGSPKLEIAGKPLYFCCEGCATYFKEHRDAVVALRGLAPR